MGTRRNQTQPSTQVPSTTPRINNKSTCCCWNKSTTIYNRPPPLLTLPTRHANATHPAPSPTHYHTPPPAQYLTTNQTTVPLYPNPPPLHAIPYSKSSSSTATQSLHPPLPSALIPQTHYPSFPHVIPPQSHTPHLNTRMGTSERHRGAQLRLTIIFSMGSYAQCTTIIEQHDGGDESNSSFLRQSNLYSIISSNIQGLNTKKQKHTVQLISELANNENTLTITLTETQ